MNTVLCYLRKLAAVENSRSLGDRELLRRFVEERDEAAFATLVERHGPLVLGVCRRTLRNEQDAEDVLQATFLVLVRKAGSISRQDAVGSWLYGVAHRLALKVRAQTARWQAAQEKYAAEATRPTATDSLSVAESQRLLDEELQCLPEKYRAPILLCCLEGKSRDEAARELGWAAGAVKIRLERGRDLLRRRLARRGLTLSTALFTTLLATDAVAATLPVRLVANLVEVGMKFAAGQSLTGLVPASVHTLAQGMLQAMAAAKLKAAASIVLLVGVLGAGAGAFTYMRLGRISETPHELPSNEFAFGRPRAQSLSEPAAVEETRPESSLPAPVPASAEKSDPRPESRTAAGVIRSVQGDRQALTVRIQEMDTTYPLASEVRVFIDGREARLDDLRAAYRVKITLTEDEKQILRVAAEGQVVSCSLRTVDADRHTIMVLWRQGDLRTSPSLRTLDVARDARVLIEGKQAQLADLEQGMELRFQFSVDGKTILGIETMAK